MVFKDLLNQWNNQLNQWFAFIVGKLSHFSQLSFGEQVSYSLVLLGLALIITAVILFIF